MNYIAALHSREYRHYLQLFSTYCEKNITDSKRHLIIPFSQGKFHVRDTKTNAEFMVTPPVYKSISSELYRLNDAVSYIMRRFTASPSQELADQIQEARKRINELELYKHLVAVLPYFNESNADKDNTVNEYKAELIELSNQNQVEKLSKEKFKRLLQLKKVVIAMEMERQVESVVCLRDHYIETMPVIEKILSGIVSSSEEDNKTVKNSRKTEKAEKAAAKAAEKAAAKAAKVAEKAAAKAAKAASSGKKGTKDEHEKFDAIRDKVVNIVIAHTYPLNKFKFSKIEDCYATFSKNKPYTITRDDLINQIKADRELMKLFPTNFATLSKEKLCNIIFKVSHGV